MNAIPTRSRFTLAWTAFRAILWRDIWVTGREFIPFLLQVLIQPLFFLFIFGKVLPNLGGGTGFSAAYAVVLLPGIVALTLFTTALQGVTLPLVLDLGFAREIDDRLQSPLPVSLVAVEKVLFAALRGLIGGTVIFPLARLILGDSYQVRTDSIPLLIVTMVLVALTGATVGLTIGTLVKPEQIGLMFSLILTPLLFTGCTYFNWAGLDALRWFQIVTLFNPLTYGSEGLRRAMTPPFQVPNPATGVPITVTLTTLDTQWVLLGLGATIVAFFIFGLRTFRSRVVS
ncbi:MAG: ABC transporter permease [Ktedonobacterales bacterium]|nr:ABC transporter permease [Ktedonobacterales bacterium]